MTESDLCGCMKCVAERIGVMAAAGARPSFMLSGPSFPGWRYACETCGNKRCPHHSDHLLACTASNKPGQVGSLFT